MRRCSSTVILHDEELGTVSTERFYTLAELQTHAPHALFLQELVSTSKSNNPTETHNSPNSENYHEDGHFSIIAASIVDIQPFSILYMLWRPDDDTVETAEAFVQLLQGALRTITETIRIVPSEESAEILSVPSLSSATSHGDRSAHNNEDRNHTTSTRQTDEQQGSSTHNHTANHEATNIPTTSLYVVVDRVAPNSLRQRSQSSITDNHHNMDDDHDPHERELAQQLVRQAASILRDQECEGISVFLSNHTRAAPGLEACMNAVTYGATDRRRHASAPQSTNDTCSSIGLIAPSPQDFLGVEAASVTDAAQNVRQACYCAEWNGRGTLASFAKRAHAQWCIHHGVPIPKTAMNKKPKRSRGRRKHSQRQNVDEQALDKAIQAFLYDFGVIAVCLGYVIFHYGQDLWKAFDAWVEQLLEQYLGVSSVPPPTLK